MLFRSHHPRGNEDVTNLGQTHLLTDLRPNARKNVTGWALTVEPVAEFHQEHVVAGRFEDAAEIAPETEVAAVERIEAALLPDHEQGRARLVFPAQHVGGAERAVVEVRVAGNGAFGGQIRRARAVCASE